MKPRLLFLLCIFFSFSCDTKKEEIKEAEVQENTIYKTETVLPPPTSAINPGEFALNEELGFIRNEIFARYGRPFKGSKYQQYFSQFPWYKINPSYSDSLLSKNDLRDISILRKYEKTLPNLTDGEVNALKKIIILMKNFRYRSLDTTITVVDDITGIGKMDTMLSHVFEQANTITVNYSLRRDSVVLWEHEEHNPYSWISDSSIFYFDSLDVWIRFFIGVYICQAELRPKESFAGIDLEEAVATGEYYFRKSNISINLQEYQQYLSDFKGKLLLYGETEPSQKLGIWYEPLQRVVPYYLP